MAFRINRGSSLAKREEKSLWPLKKEMPQFCIYPAELSE